MIERPEEPQAAHCMIESALAESHEPAVDHVVDAVLALLAYVERFPVPRAVSEEPDRESILTDPAAIAERHSVDMTSLLNRIEVETVQGRGVLLARNEAFFLCDLLQVLGFE